MTPSRIDNIETRASETAPWKPVFLFAYGDIDPRQAKQYLEINAELGWDKYRIVYRVEDKLCDSDIYIGGTFYMCDRRGTHTIHAAEGDPSVTWSEV